MHYQIFPEEYQVVEHQRVCELQVPPIDLLAPCKYQSHFQMTLDWFRKLPVVQSMLYFKNARSVGSLKAKTILASGTQFLSRFVAHNVHVMHGSASITTILLFRLGKHDR